jgi:hypothetical protein
MYRVYFFQPEDQSGKMFANDYFNEEARDKFISDYRATIEVFSTPEVYCNGNMDGCPEYYCLHYHDCNSRKHN